MNAVPLTVALLAGGLAVFNPCGFPVLSAFLAYNLGDDGARSRAPNQIARGLMTGLMVTIGFLAVFTALGLPVSLGVAVISDVVPWVGLAFGAALLAVGLATLAGRHIGLPQLDPVRFQTRHRATTQLTFGVGYGVASLACTLPLFLALVGAGAGGRGATATLAVFAAYGAGMAAVLMALAVGAALVRGGVTRWARRVLPHMQPLAGVLLTVAGGYLVYFWVLTEFASRTVTATDPLVGAVTDFAAQIEARAASGGTALIILIAAFVACAALLSLWQSRRMAVAGHHRSDAGPGRDAGAGPGATAGHQVTLEHDRTAADVAMPGDPGRDRAPARSRLAVVAAALPLLLLGGLVGRGLTVSGGPASSNCVAPVVPQGPMGAPARPATEEELAELRTECDAEALSSLVGVDGLRSMFNDDVGSPRVVALLSPTCITCLRGAAWLQAELADNPNADVRVYAVWMPVLASDGRTEWEGRILSDPRVTHSWDQELDTGFWFADEGFGFAGTVLWDALLVYGPDARWEAGGGPSDPLVWDYPIITGTDAFAEVLRPLLTR